MKIADILSLIKPLEDLNAFTQLSAKVRWNLAKNLKIARAVHQEHQEHVGAIIEKLAPGAGKIEQDNPKWPEAVKLVNELADVEDDAVFLKFPSDHILRDDVAIPAALLMALEPLIEEPPCE